MTTTRRSFFGRVAAFFGLTAIAPLVESEKAIYGLDGEPKRKRKFEWDLRARYSPSQERMVAASRSALTQWENELFYGPSASKPTRRSGTTFVREVPPHTFRYCRMSIIDGEPVLQVSNNTSGPWRELPE